MPRVSSTPRILILFAHPLPRTSRVNRRLIDAARTLPTVTVQDLYETYPDFHIDVAREQALLTAADLVIFQHPVQWYGMPSLLKEWTDVVLEAGWAYGEQGRALRGKDYLLVLTTGSLEEAYRADGVHRHAFDAFLAPFEQTAHFCGMRWLPPLVLHGAHQVTQSAVDAHVARYTTLLSTYPLWCEG